MGLDVLTEVIDVEETERAIRLGAKIFGINHRNLHDLSIDLTRSKTLSELLPEGSVVVSESGIRDNKTVRSLGNHSNAYLVGSQLTSAPDVDRAARALVYGENKVCGLTTWSAAQAARAAGAVYGGLVFEEASPRNVSRETAEDIIAHEPDLDYVAVSRRTEGWVELAAIDGVEALQLHAPYRGSIEAELDYIHTVVQEVRDAGIPVTSSKDEDLDFGAEQESGLQIWRAVSMSHTDGPALAQALIADKAVDRIVLDSGNGGTGTSFEWATVPAEVLDYALLAGGIGLDNIEQALKIGTVGVDLNSGLETVKGTKDTGLIARAFATIRNFYR